MSFSKLVTPEHILLINEANAYKENVLQEMQELREQTEEECLRIKENAKQEIKDKIGELSKELYEHNKAQLATLLETINSNLGEVVYHTLSKFGFHSPGISQLSTIINQEIEQIIDESSKIRMRCSPNNLEPLQNLLKEHSYLDINNLHITTDVSYSDTQISIETKLGVLYIDQALWQQQLINFLF